MKKETQTIIKAKAAFFNNLGEILGQPLTAYVPHFQNHYAIVEVAKVNLTKGTCTLRILTTQHPNLAIPLAKIDSSRALPDDKFQAITIPYELECPLEKLPAIEKLINEAAISPTGSQPIVKNIHAFDKQILQEAEKPIIKLSQMLDQHHKLDTVLKSQLLDSETTVIKTTAQLINTKYPKEPRQEITHEIIKYNKLGVFEAAQTKTLYTRTLPHIRKSKEMISMATNLKDNYIKLEYRLAKLSEIISKVFKC